MEPPQRGSKAIWLSGKCPTCIDNRAAVRASQVQHPIVVQPSIVAGGTDIPYLGSFRRTFNTSGEVDLLSNLAKRIIGFGAFLFHKPFTISILYYPLDAFLQEKLQHGNKKIQKELQPSGGSSFSQGVEICTGGIEFAES